MDEDAEGGSIMNGDKESWAVICLSKQSNRTVDGMEATSSSSANSVTYSNPSLPVATFEQFDLFRRDLLLCDVHLQTDDGRTVHAHRLILAATIPYFKSLFTKEWKDSKDEVVSIQGISYEALTQLIDFVYTNRIAISNASVQHLLHSASFLQMDYVISCCESFLSQQLSLENCLQLRSFSMRYECKTLRNDADKFAADNFREMYKLSEFYDISFDHLLDLIKRSDLNVRSENEAFEAIVNWIERDKQNRQIHFPTLFSQIRLSQLSTPFLCDVVRVHPLVLECSDCSQQLTDAVFDRLSAPQNSFGSQISLSGSKSSGLENSDSYKATRENVPSNSLIRLNQLEPRTSIAGTIFCAGGRGTAGDPFKSVEAYSLRLNQWFSAADMLQQRRHVGLACTKGRLYAIGGHNGVNHLATAEVLDPEVGCWKMVSPMAYNRRGIAVAAIQNAIYAVGGLDDTTCFNAVERYDVESDTWRLVAEMNVKRGGVGLAVLDNCLYAVGGNDGSSSLDSCEKYCPFTDKWSLVASMKSRRAGAGVCELNGSIYVVGGFDDNSPLNSCERYDVQKNEWTTIASMSCARGGVGVASLSGYVFALGGHDGSQYLSTVEKYNPQTNTWSPVAEIKECRAGSGVAFGDCWIDDFLRNPNDYKLPRAKNNEYRE